MKCPCSPSFHTKIASHTKGQQQGLIKFSLIVAFAQRMLFRGLIFITANLFGKMLCNVHSYGVYYTVFCIAITYKKMLKKFVQLL